MKKVIITLCLIMVVSIASTKEVKHFFAKGMVAFEEGNYANAEKNFSVALKNSYVKDPKICFWLGRTYIALQDYVKAYEMLTYYKSNHLGTDTKSIDRILEMLHSEIVFSDSARVYFTLECLPPNINSKDDDSAPVITSDGKTMYFTSNRNAIVKKENIWKVDKLYGKWETPSLVRELSSNNNEAVASISENKNTIYLFGNFETQKKTGSIYSSTRTKKRWGLPHKLENVNTKYLEMHPYVYNDSVMFFTSVRNDCIGGSDIYVSEKIAGEWTHPLNLGSVVNTEQYEQTPFLDWDGKTLYFSSNGHPGLGGFDIFKTTKIGDGWQDWSVPENLGLRINSVRDDRYFFHVKNSDDGFLSSNRMNGVGSEDIYSFNVKSVKIPRSEKKELAKNKFQIYGNVYCKKINQAELQITDFTWKYYLNNRLLKESIEVDTLGNYQVKVFSGAKKYSYIISAKRCWTSEVSLHIGDVKNYQHNIKLEKIEEDTLYTIPNIHFDFGKATLKKNSFPIIDNLAITLRNSPDMQVEIGGHTDNIDTEKFNMKLSQDRAQSVVDYLIGLGIDMNRIRAIGYGESLPVASNDTPKGREQNRRVEMKFAKFDKGMTENERLQDELIKVKQELNELKKKEKESKLKTKTAQ